MHQARPTPPLVAAALAVFIAPVRWEYMCEIVDIIDISRSLLFQLKAVGRREGVGVPTGGSGPSC
jgi:hypothetical protein